MPIADTGLVKARHVFTKHKGMLRTSDAIRLGVQGEAVVDGQGKQTFVTPAFAYIPPATRHNAANTGKDLLEYVYVVAPAKLS